MTASFKTTLRKATADDAEDLAKLIDIAGEGIPSWLWQQSAGPGQSPLSVGFERARRENGGFSYRNAIVAQQGTTITGMILSYPIDLPPEDNPDELPAPIAPFVALERHSVGTWYVNALAVIPAFRGCGIGSKLLQAVENHAPAAGYNRLSIQVYAQNTGAVRLYQRLGFRETARTPVRDHPCPPHYTGDVILLMKSLAPTPIQIMTEAVDADV